jgi:hypothetical protein
MVGYKKPHCALSLLGPYRLVFLEKQGNFLIRAVDVHQIKFLCLLLVGSFSFLVPA